MCACTVSRGKSFHSLIAFGKKLNLPKGNVKKISEIVYKNRNRKFLKRFYPFYWRIVSLLIKVIPFNLILSIKNLISKD